MAHERPRVAVIGVGSMGSMALWQLARRGYNVVGFERMGVPHDGGGHGAESRIFRVAYREGAEYIPLLQQSRELWAELQGMSQRPFFLPIGCLYMGEAGAPWLKETIAGAVANELDHEVLTSMEISQRFPQHRLSGNEMALLDKAGGLLRPELAVLAAAQAACRMGAQIHAESPVSKVRPLRDGVEIVVGGQRLQFDYAVITTGAWGARLMDEPPVRIVARRIVGSWYGVDTPADYTPGRFPVCIREGKELQFSGFPCLDGWTIKVMPPVNFESDVDPIETDRRVSRDDTAITRQVERDLLKGVHPEPVRTGVFLDGFTVDDHPVIDFCPGADRIVLALGFSGHGFKMATGVGAAVAELIEKGGNNYVGAHFAAGRLPRTDEPHAEQPRARIALR